MRDRSNRLLDERGLRWPARELSAVLPRAVGLDQHPISRDHSSEFLIALTITDFGCQRNKVAGVDYRASGQLVGFMPVKNRAANFRGEDYFESLGGASMRCVENQGEIHLCRDS